MEEELRLVGVSAEKVRRRGRVITNVTLGEHEHLHVTGAEGVDVEEVEEEVEEAKRHAAGAASSVK